MIGRDSFKGVPSVVIDTGSLKAVFLPENLSLIHISEPTRH